LISQTCTAIVGVTTPIETNANTTFEILTNPTFDFSLNLCKDSLCNNKSNIFIQEGDIYFSYNSSLEQISTIANLTYPDGKIENLDIPSSIKAEQIGTYNLEITVSKEGYKTIVKKIQFGVIEKEAKISYVDLEKEKQKLSNNIPNYVFIILGIILVLGSIILIIYLVKRKSNK